jgi:hypothetical protein
MTDLKLFLIATITGLLIFSFSIPLNAQCNIVSGMSGTVHDSASSISVSYNVTLTTGASLTNLGQFFACGILFPSIMAPWSGNSNVIDTVTYTFSSPITSIDVVVGYVGVTGLIAPESFIFTTNGSLPVLTVDSGTCEAWIVSGNEITSPSIINGLNAIVTVVAALPFTDLCIISGSFNSSFNGGSSYGLCDASLETNVYDIESYENNLLVYPNPVSNVLTISFGREVSDLSVKLINLLGEVVSERNEFFSNRCTLDVSSISSGIYIAEINVEGNKIQRKIIKN